ncbi:MAG TPA: hypothetical protein VF314_00225 [Actinomycetes bacterium]
MSWSDVWAPAMLSLAFAADYVGVTVDHVAGWPISVGLALVTVVTAACCVRVRLPIALGVAVLGWAFLTGFVVNHYGQLRVTGTGDLWRLLMLLGTAALVSRATTPLIPGSDHARSVAAERA